MPVPDGHRLEGFPWKKSRCSCPDPCLEIPPLSAPLPVNRLFRLGWKQWDVEARHSVGLSSDRRSVC